MTISVHHGDMLALLPTLGARFHAVITDPPYHLTTDKRGGTGPASLNLDSPAGRSRISTGFMGKAWDGGDIAFRPETWALVGSVMLPGAHLVAFGGTRGAHRMACAIEDAGFEIRDTLAWLYGSGFPKSHNVSKAIDKAAGAEREVVGRSNRNLPKTKFDGLNGGAFQEKPGMGEFITAPATDDARTWEGWGTALKPAYEPIILARWPFKGTVAGNVLAHGTGALNIDACKISAKGRPAIEKNIGKPDTDGHSVFGKGLSPRLRTVGTTDAGRWPANVVHDGSEEVIAAFPQTASVVFGSQQSGSPWAIGAERSKASQSRGISDSGSAARFFYSAKADAGDRLASKHPTVKPVDLMRWLVRLITPPRGLVLDPFAGSGTTGMACMAEGFDCHLIEREADYVADIRRRIAHVSGADTPLFTGEAT